MRKPLIGTILGVLIGISVALVLARQGIWPMDQLTLFLLPAVIGLIGMLLLTVGRPGRKATLIISLIILVPMAVWGALGLLDVAGNGQLDGGCAVVAESAIDQTVVTDTAKADPFLIDPDGGLAWMATSPTVFTDYEWEIDVVLGGIPVTLDSGTEPNDEGDMENADQVESVAEYAGDRGIDIDLLTGVYEVGGFADTCDGSGYVELAGDGLDGIGLGALILALLLLIILVVLVFTGRNGMVVESSTTVVGRHQVEPGDARE